MPRSVCLSALHRCRDRCALARQTSHEMVADLTERKGSGRHLRAREGIRSAWEGDLPLSARGVAADSPPTRHTRTRRSPGLRGRSATTRHVAGVLSPRRPTVSRDPSDCGKAHDFQNPHDCMNDGLTGLL